MLSESASHHHAADVFCSQFCEHFQAVRQKRRRLSLNMADDDFEIPQETPPPATPVASSRRTSRGSTASSTTEATKGRSKLCGFPACDDDCKAGRRHCGHHHRHLDNARNQVIKAKGEEAGKAFMDKCKDMEFANGQIEYMQKRSVGLPMFARAPLIDFVAWEQEFGTLVATKSGSQLRPFEEDQWIIRQVTKFGRDKAEMKQEWKRKLAASHKRDFLGYQGCVRLWLPALEFEENSETQYAKGASKETSKGKKRPKDYETDAFRRHATECGFDLGHSFFSGKAASMDDAGCDEGDVPMQSEGPAASALEQSRVSAAKRKVADALDASDDEDAGKTKSKKKKSASSMASARASLFDSVSKQMSAKESSINIRIGEAQKAQTEEAKAPSCVAATDLTTRRMYNSALSACLDLVLWWKDPDALKKAVEKHNQDMKAKGDDKSDKLVVDVAAEDQITAQSPSLQWALQHAGSSISLERGIFLRTKTCMDNFVKAIPHGEMDEDTLEKQRLIWRRMFNCLTQLEQCLKKSTADVNKHVSGVASAIEKESKRKKDKDAREAAAKHMASVQEKVRKAKAEGTEMAGIFKLDKATELEAMM